MPTINDYIKSISDLIETTASKIKFATSLSMSTKEVLINMLEAELNYLCAIDILTKSNLTATTESHIRNILDIYIYVLIILTSPEKMVARFLKRALERAQTYQAKQEALVENSSDLDMGLKKARMQANQHRELWIKSETNKLSAFSNLQGKWSHPGKVKELIRISDPEEYEFINVLMAEYYDYYSDHSHSGSMFSLYRHTLFKDSLGIPETEKNTNERLVLAQIVNTIHDSLKVQALGDGLLFILSTLTEIDFILNLNLRTSISPIWDLIKNINIDTTLLANVFKNRYKDYLI